MSPVPSSVTACRGIPPPVLSASAPNCIDNVGEEGRGGGAVRPPPSASGASALLALLQASRGRDDAAAAAIADAATLGVVHPDGKSMLRTAEAQIALNQGDLDAAHRAALDGLDTVIWRARTASSPVDRSRSRGRSVPLLGQPCPERGGGVLSQSAQSAAVMPSRWPGGHWTSSIRLPSGSTIQVGRKSFEPSCDVGSSASMPRAASVAMVASIDSTLMTKWLRPVLRSTCPAGSWTNSMVTNSSSGSLSMVRWPNPVSGTLPATS